MSSGSDNGLSWLIYFVLLAIYLMFTYPINSTPNRDPDPPPASHRWSMD